ncbi:MAG: tyrosine--tRNA ligase [Simkaniaceae bacterium]|nr:tyrosine--tRNA ligase [Simkaniaceae bacterium]
MKDFVVAHLKKRGFIDAVTSEDLLLKASSPLKLYLGFDPTADSLHLGNLVGIIALTWFEKFGHTPYALLGGATGKIGDPSGKSQERPFLSYELLEHNIGCIEKQLIRCIGHPLIVNNDTWFKEMPFIDFLRDVGKHFRVGSMLGKESVRSRIQSEEGMSFTEFSYQLMQAYDFYHLYEKEGVVLQMGGSDQWGNITAGIELIRKLTRKEAFGATFPLLTRSDGKKFGKSEEGAIWLSKEKTSPYAFYQYLYQVADADVVKLLKMLTFIELEEIEEMEREIKIHPNRAQKRLAEEVTLYVHGAEGLEIALRVTEGAKPGQDIELDLETLEAIKEDMPNVTLSKDQVVGQTYPALGVLSSLFSSKGEAVRLLKNGGAYLNNRKISDEKEVVCESDLIGGKYLVLGSGKKKKLLIEISSLSRR